MGDQGTGTSARWIPHAEDVEQKPADGVAGVVDCSSEIQGDTLLRQLVGDIRCVSQRSRETVELDDDQDVVSTAGSEYLPAARPGPSRLRQTMVNMHELIVNTERRKAITSVARIRQPYPVAVS